MGRACSTNGGEEECIEDIGGESRIEFVFECVCMRLCV
jgi:hypothetical protein